MKVVQGCIDQIQLLREIRDGNNDPELDLWPLSALENEEANFLSVAEVLWPEVVVVDGLVFLKAKYNEATYRELLTGDLTMVQVQYLINHVHVMSEIISNKVPDEFIEPVVKTVQMFWEKTLAEYDVVVDAFISEWDDSEVCVYNRSLVESEGR